MKLKFVLLFCFSLFLIQPTQAFIIPSPAWGSTGHRTVGKIADTYLKGSTKRAIKKLLNRHTLAFVSTYGDEIKSDDRYRKFSSWHYVNMEANQSYEESEKALQGDAVTGAEYCVKVLKDKNASDDDKAFYLKLLIHIIGDIHQPMHAGLAEDKGGNDIKVKWMGKDTNLHRVWDSDMLNGFDMSYTELAINADALSKEQIKLIETGTITDWVNETHTLANAIYKDVKTGDNLGYEYAYRNLSIARSQIQKGGIRLAKLLNDIF
ncbi:S1/P1 nuclease [Formosa sediminum]|uniref:S1/P1 nuclease n=1 Tax=Formosa sediminum TaxID=2594004 RepID=A0A516GR49_9FLAO|nr:S1/P1 nuclease [Formosa sediminum]QDO94005.1 S1/P1 nuclease [Formosa sediminum]